ncbi:UDP-N-acetylmuramoyl-L-alanyl-D-glutamate--2,6-diaminopimelate ligase [soil metagenome]
MSAGSLSAVPDPIPTRPAHAPGVPLTEVTALLGERLVAVHGQTKSVDVSGLTISSRQVRAGDLYAAPAGSLAHGAVYAAQAVEGGAVAVLTDPAGAEICASLPVPSAVPVLVVERPRAVLGALAAHVYGEPAVQLRLMAVTGTQGKTTTTRLAEGALTTSDVPAAVIGTVGTRVNGTEVASLLTTPEAPDLHALFAVMVEQGVQACAMEVSSHALVMGRVDGVVFDVACFTNLGRDHLDFHPDQEAYFAAKASLFTTARARLAVVNIDDGHGRRLAAEARIPVRTYSVGDAQADWWADRVATQAGGSTFTLHTPAGASFDAAVPLTGDFNVSNALCAIAALTELGYDARTVAAGLAASGGVPGRLERVDAGQQFLAIVDYAHKPDAVQAALSALRPQTAGRLLVVIGAGGERDPGKRPLMGEIASRLADVVVVTDDNPRGEDPAAIRAAILAGAEQVPAAGRAELHEVGSRRRAIRLAVSLAGPGDVLVVAGKGHEKGQEVRRTVQPFDDREVLREELAAR